VAGPPDTVDPDDPWAAFEGRVGAVLAAFSAVDGKKLAEYSLESAPVYDGIAATDNRLYISLNNGSLICFSGSQPRR
jgi:hypothetical protein